MQKKGEYDIRLMKHAITQKENDDVSDIPESYQAKWKLVASSEKNAQTYAHKQALKKHLLQRINDEACRREFK